MCVSVCACKYVCVCVCVRVSASVCMYVSAKGVYVWWIRWGHALSPTHPCSQGSCQGRRRTSRRSEVGSTPAVETAALSESDVGARPAGQPPQTTTRPPCWHLSPAHVNHTDGLLFTARSRVCTSSSSTDSALPPDPGHDTRKAITRLCRPQDKPTRAPHL